MLLSDSVMTVYLVRQLAFSVKPVFPVPPPNCMNHFSQRIGLCHDNSCF